MHMESIKLSPKKNGKGYVSSYSVSVASKEVRECGLLEGRLIKVVDEENGEIIIKNKRYTLTPDIIETVIQLNYAVREENERINHKYFPDGKARTTEQMLKLFTDEHSGKIERIAEQRLVEYLSDLPVETVGDLLLLMYLGRDFDGNTDVPAGEERFLNFYDRYGYLVHGESKETLIESLLDRTPLNMFLKTGVRILNVPIGTSLNTMTHNWNEM